MKQTKLLLGLALFALAVTSWAATPTYKSKTGNGDSTTPAQVIFPSDASTQIRLISVWWENPTNGARIMFSSGGAAKRATGSAVSAQTSNWVDSTVGLVTNTTLVCEIAGVGYSTTLVATNNTNLIWIYPALGVAITTNSSWYVMGTETSYPIQDSTNALVGEAIFVAEPGRPMRVRLSTTAATNRILSASARYE
jgi:hypothetical protein